MIVREITKAWTFFRERGFREILLSREAPFLIQFGKYGVCGVLSVIVFFIIVFLGESLFPESFGQELHGNLRARNIALLHLAAFLPSNFTAYALNRWLVFTPGRHSARKELILFTAVSFLSFALGEFLPFWLIKNANVPTFVVHLSFVLSSALVNFGVRKFLVFEK